MTTKEFLIEIKRLELNYGKELEEELKRQWFQEFKQMTIERFKLIVTTVMKREKYMPRLYELFQVNKELASLEINKNEIKKYKCSICGGDGFIVYSKINKGFNYEYVCKCMCRNAEKYKAYPSFEQVGLKI